MRTNNPRGNEMNLLATATLALLASAGLAATAPEAAAQEPQPVSHANGLSQGQLAEARARASTAKRLFFQIDQDGDGRITPEEWWSWHDREFAADTKRSQGSEPAAD
jgi:hypothetical protein